MITQSTASVSSDVTGINANVVKVEVCRRNNGYRKGAPYWRCTTDVMRGPGRPVKANLWDLTLFRALGYVKLTDTRWEQIGVTIDMTDNPVPVRLMKDRPSNIHYEIAMRKEPDMSNKSDDRQVETASAVKQPGDKFMNNDYVVLTKDHAVGDRFTLRAGSVGQVVITDQGTRRATFLARRKYNIDLPVITAVAKKLEHSTEEAFVAYQKDILNDKQVKSNTQFEPGDRIRLTTSNEIFTFVKRDGDGVLLLRDNGSVTSSVLPGHATPQFHGVNQEYLDSLKPDDGEAEDADTGDKDNSIEALKQRGTIVEQPDPAQKQADLQKQINNLQEKIDNLTMENARLNRRIHVMVDQHKKELDAKEACLRDARHNLFVYQQRDNHTVPQPPKMVSREVVKPISGVSEYSMQQYIVDKQSEILALQYVDGQWHAVFKYTQTEPAQRVIDEIEEALSTPSDPQAGTYSWSDEEVADPASVRTVSGEIVEQPVASIDDDEDTSRPLSITELFMQGWSVDDVKQGMNEIVARNARAVLESVDRSPQPRTWAPLKPGVTS